MAVNTRTNRLNFIALAREATAASYQALPRVVAVSILWCMFLPTLVLIAPTTAVVFAAARSTIQGETFGTSGAWRAFKRFFWRSQAFFVPMFVLIDLSWWLWFHGQAANNFLYIAGALIVFDFLLVYGYLLVYYFPLLVARDNSALETARSSIELALRRVRTTIGVVSFVVSLAVLFGFTVAGFVLLGPGLATTVLSLATGYLDEENG